MWVGWIVLCGSGEKSLYQDPGVICRGDEYLGVYVVWIGDLGVYIGQ